MIVTDLADQLDQHAQDGDDGLIFTSPEGTPLWHGNFTRRTWLPAMGKAGLTGVHFHDLRHAGNHYTASGREPARADGAHGSRHEPRRDDLSALH